MRTACVGSSITRRATHERRGDVENFLEAEKERYREQLERYARLMLQRDDRPIRLGLYFPLLGEWLRMGRASGFAQAGVAVRAVASGVATRYVKMQLPTLFHTSGT